MKQAGQIVLTPFPYTDLSGAKLRPVLMLRKASCFDDWLLNKRQRLARWIVQPE